MIWLAAAILILLALLGLSLPWWSPRFMRPRGVARRATNVQLYRERLAQLPGDVAAGTLSAEAAEELKAELAARLLQDAGEPAPELKSAPGSRLAPLVAVGLLAVFAIGWYSVSGTWRSQALIELAKTNPEAAHLIAVERATSELEAHLKKEPNDADSWIWLARTYRGREKYPEAINAFARASELKGGEDPDVLAEWGEAIAYSQQGSLAGEPAAKFEAALKIAPDHPHALWYAGVAALHSGDAATAVAHWDRLLKQDLPEELRATLAARVAELREKNHLPAPKAQAAAAAPAGPVVLKVAVDMTPEMKQLVAATDRLFVYAADPGGPPMPLAVKTFDVSQLPKLTVELSDADSPMPTRKLSSVQRWRVVARVSKSGSAIPQAGDLEGSVEVDRAAAGKPVAVRIDHARQ